VKRSVSQEKLAICTVEIDKGETSLRHIDEVVEYLKRCVEAEPLARFIAVYDHHAHTLSLPGGVVAEGILAAKNLVFCFGITLPSPEAMALRPRSIGVCELADRFVVTFTEPPMPVANLAMEKWASLVCDRQVAVAGAEA
jgi:hypothetical protein